MKENNHYKFIERSKKQTGFTLLAAIITTSMLLIISFVVANVALKQLALSYSSEESQYSFYNADSGTECAIFWDLKNTGVVSSFATTTADTIFCNGQSISVASPVVHTTPFPPGTATLVGGGGNANPTSIFELDFPKGCAIVKVTKSYPPQVPYNGQVLLTQINSYGYNTCDTSAIRRFERGVSITY